jgi:phage shock protein E
MTNCIAKRLLGRALALLGCASLLAGCAGTRFAESAAAPSSTRITHVEPVAAADMLKSNPDVVVVDVRTPGEFEGGRIAGAENIDFNAPDFEANLSKLDRETPVLVHCAAGGRSTRSLEVFERLGFQSVTHLDGGLNAWKAAGLPVETGSPAGGENAP